MNGIDMEGIIAHLNNLNITPLTNVQSNMNKIIIVIVDHRSLIVQNTKRKLKNKQQEQYNNKGAE